MTFPAENQFYYFWACFYVGVLSSVVYAFLAVLRFFIKGKITAILCDIGYFLCFAAIYVFFSVRWKFPELRPYMPIAAVAGAVVSVAILRNTLAKFAVILYNLFIKIKQSFSERINDGKKSAEIGIGGGSRSRCAVEFSAYGSGLPDDMPVSGKKRTFGAEKNERRVRQAHRRNSGRNRRVDERVENRGSGAEIRFQKER